MTRWFVCNDAADTTPGFVDAHSPYEAAKNWNGETYDDSPVFVVEARHVHRLLPILPHRTQWELGPLEEKPS